MEKKWKRIRKRNLRWAAAAFLIALAAMILTVDAAAYQMQPQEESGQEQAVQEQQEQAGSRLLEELNLEEADDTLDELLGETNFSLKDTVFALMHGEIPLDGEHLLTLLKDALFQEMNTYRKTAGYLLLLILASAVFLNFCQVLEDGQTAGISYYMMYLLMITLLMKVFLSMNQIAQGAVESVLTFMKVLVPACSITLFFTSGSGMALGFYQLVLLAIAGVQWIYIRILLPIVQIYVILLFLNQMTKEDHISKLADLVKTVILWSIRTTTAVLIGMQAIQCLILPPADQMKNSVLQRVITVIPGLGNAYESVSGVVVGTALLLKNSVGIAGVLALLLLGAVPAAKLAFGALIYKALGAAAQPVTDKRVAECISGVAEGAELLLRLLLSSVFLFLLSLAMIAALVRS